MSFQIENKDKYVLVTLQPEKLGGVIALELKANFVNINANGNKNIILDMGATRYCDSSGLSAILVGNRLCKNSGGVFVICGLQPMVQKLVSISQLDSILNITGSLTEAQDFLYMEEVEKEIKGV